MSRSEPQVIAIVAHQAFSLANFRGELIKELVTQGLQVVTLAPDFDADSRAKVQALGALAVDYRLDRTGTNPLADSASVLALAVALRRIRPQALLCYSTKPVILGTIAGWLAGIPHRVALIEGLGYAFTPRSDAGNAQRRILQHMVALLFRLALTLAHRVMVLNKDDFSALIDGRLVSADKVEIIDGIGVDLAYWSCESSVRSPVTFVLAARLLVEKGVREYAAAARRIKKLHPAVRFLLLGGLDSNPGALSGAEVQSWVDEGFLEWPGHVEVKPWLEQASVFVLPSYREGMPRSTQEAVALGRPVITTDVPGCRDTVLDGVNGYLVAPRDSLALAEAMERFIAHPELIVTMGAASRQMAALRFDVKVANKKIITAMGIY